jgi:hypothetical protein
MLILIVSFLLLPLTGLQTEVLNRLAWLMAQMTCSREEVLFWVT